MAIKRNTEKNLSRLTAVLSCIDTPESPAEAKRNDLLQKIKRVFQKIIIFIIRLFWAIVYFQWFNNDKASKLVKAYIFDADANQKNSALNKEIHQIYDKLIALNRTKPYLLGIDKRWIDSTPDEKPRFQRAEQMGKISAKMLFHIHANEFGANNTTLEGFTARETLGYLRTFLTQRQKQGLTLYGLTPQTLTQVVNAADQCGQPENLPANIRQSFAENKPLLIDGGWSGAPAGHAMFYEIIPDSNETATFRLYNLGAGSGNHAGALIGNKVKRLPYTDFKGVSREALLDANTLKALQELKTYAFFPTSSTKTEYDAKDVYVGLRALLRPTSIDVGNNEDLDVNTLKTTQSSGVCAWRSLLAFLATRMPKEQFKQFVCDVKLQSLADYIAQSSQKGWQADEWRLLERAQQKTAKAVRKAYTAQLIGTQHLFYSSAKLQRIARHINMNRDASLNARHLPKAKELHQYSWNLSNPIDLDSSAKEPLSQQLLHAKEEPAACTFVFSKVANLINFRLDPREQLSQLGSLLKKAADADEWQALQCSMLQWLRQVDIAEFCKPLREKDQAQKAIADLGNLAKTYFESCFRVPDPEVIHPERHFVLLKLLRLQARLFDSFAPGVEAKITMEMGKSVKDLFFRLTDSELHEQMALTEHKYNISSFNFDGNKEIGKSSNLSASKHSKSLTLVGKQFAYLDQAMAADDPGYAALDRYQKDAALYASDKLPDWYQALRDTFHYYLHLDRECVSAPPSGTLDCSLEYSVKHEDYFSYVNFAVKGVTGEFLANNPIANSTRLHPLQRYEGLFPPLRNPALRDLLRSIAETINGYPRLTEKSLLADHVDNHGFAMSDELFKEISHMFTKRTDYSHKGDECVQAAEAFAFFCKQPNKLADTDYQTLFQLLLFSPNGLHNSLNLRDFAKQWDSFLQSQINHFSTENSIQAAVFLLRMCRLMKKFYPRGNEFTGSFAKLAALLDKKNLFPEEKYVIYAEIAAALSQQERLENEELSLLLSATAYCEKYSAPAHWNCPQTKKEMRSAVQQHALAICHYLADGDGNANDAALNCIAEATGSASNSSWQMSKEEGSFPHFISNGNPKTTYYPLTGKFVTENQPLPLPIEIKSHPHFKQLFADNIEEALPKGGGAFELNDKYGNQTLLALHHGDLTIEQFREGNWYRFIPPAKLLSKSDDKWQSPLASRHLAQNYHHWHNLANSEDLAIVDPATGLRCFSVKLADSEITVHHSKKSIKKALKYCPASVVRCSDGLKLRIPHTNLFDAIEDPAFIQEWYCDNPLQLRQVELPRFGMSFSYDSTKQKLFSDQWDGFYLCEKQSLPLLGSFKNYLLLQNEHGERKLLMPQQFLSKLSKPDERQALEPKHLVDRQLAPDLPFKQKMIAFNVSSQGNLATPSLAGKLTLAYALTIAQEYADAGQLLRKYGPKLSRYSGEIETILLDLTQLGDITGDMSANGIALRLYGKYLLLKNLVDHQCHVPKELKEGLGNDISNYLSHFRSITANRLQREEEGFLIKYVLQECYDSKLFLRLCQLDPGYAHQYLPPQNEELTNEENRAYNFQEILRDSCPEVHSKDISRDAILLTRIRGYFKQHFCQFYEIARCGTEQDKKWLRDALLFFRHQPGKAWGTLLKTVLEHPEMFEPASSAFHSDKQKKWWLRVLKAADQCSKIDMKIVAQPIDEISNMTPKDFLLDEQKPLSSLPELKFQTKPLPSFAELAISKEWFQRASPKQTHNSILMSWLMEEANQPACEEPLYRQQIANLSKDLAELQKNVTEGDYLLNVAALGEMEEALTVGRNEANNRLLQLEASIVALANKSSSEPDQLALDKLSLYSGHRQPLTLQELLIYFGRQDFNTLWQRNEYLNIDDFKHLCEAIAEYLIAATHEQQRARIVKQIAEVRNAEKHPKLLQEAVQELAARLFAERAYKPAKNPAYLVFEYYADILLRPAQTAKLEQLLQSGDLNPVMEMIMGSGKSKVLLPLLGLLRADGKTLSTLIVPQPLFESVASDTLLTLYESFGISLHALHFDRNTLFSSFMLKSIRDDLLAAKNKRECLIMTSKSLQCFVLKFLEKSFEYLSKGEFPEELMLMREILLLLGPQAFPLIDEADTVLNVLHEVCFSMGAKRSVDQNDAAVASLLFEILFTDKEIKSKGRCDSDSSGDLAAPILTEELYQTSVKPHLANKFIQKLATATFDSPDLTRDVQACFTQLTEEDFTLAVQYLCHDSGNRHAAQSFYDRQSTEVKDILALAGQQISHLLPHTLTRICEVNYGIDDKSSKATSIPFAAASTPNRGSEFADANVTVNYTFQYYLKMGVSKEIARREIERLQLMAMNELKDDPSLALHETKAWQHFLKIQGDNELPLFNFKEQHLDKLVAEINNNADRIRLFVKETILPQIELFSHKISCNPHNLMAIFLRAIGFTGTLWNSKSMHSMLDPTPEAGTDLQTINLLWQNSRQEVYEIAEGSPKMMMEQLNEKNINYDMISDGGGYFKEGGNEAVAAMMSDFAGKPVVFYNKGNQQTEIHGQIQVPLSESKTAIGDRLTFLDQAHTTGADVKQKADAVAIVTIGSNMLLRDLLQSVWRLRGLDKGQRVKFVLSNEVASIIRQRLHKASQDPIAFDDILRFVMANQVEQQGKDNFKGLRQELASIIQSQLLNVLLNAKSSIAEMRSAVDLLQEEWIKETSKRPSELFGVISSKEESVEVVKMEKEKYLQRIVALHEQLPFLEGCSGNQEQACLAIEEICSSVVSALPAKVTVPLRDTDADNTVEVEQQLRTETQTELQVQQQRQTNTIKLGSTSHYEFKYYSLDKWSAVEDKKFTFVPYFSLQDYCSKDQTFAALKNSFAGINVSLNALAWPKENPSLSNIKLLGPHRTPLHFIEILDNGEVIILSQDDARAKIESYNSHRLYHLNFGFFDSRRDLSKELQAKLIQIKFLNGESSYNKAELKLLKKWIRQEGPVLMREFFCKQILAGFPDKAAAYSRSNLRDLFQKEERSLLT